MIRGHCCAVLRLAALGWQTGGPRKLSFNISVPAQNVMQYLGVAAEAGVTFLDTLPELAVTVVRELFASVYENNRTFVLSSRNASLT